MKKLYTLTLRLAAEQSLVITGVFFFGLCLLLSPVSRWSQTPLQPALIETSSWQENISVCGPSPEGSTAALPLSLTQANEFVFASQGSIKWSWITPQPVVNSEAQVAVVGGKLYSFGGFDRLKKCCTPTDRAYVFDPADQSWTPIKNMPAMNGSGHGGVTHSGFTTDGVDIYFAGGYTSNSAGTGQIYGTKEVWKYDVSEDTYSRLPGLPDFYSAGGLEYLNGKLHWIGGTNKPRTLDLGIHYVLDLSNTGAGWKSLAPLPNPRNHLGSAVHGGKIYIFGGQHGHDSKLVTQKDVHRYDPTTNQWTKMADMPQALSHITGSTFTYGDRIFILGGEKANGVTNYVASVVAYNPLSNDWTQYNDMPSKRASGVAGAINGIIYYSTGNAKSTFKGVLQNEPQPPPPPPSGCTGIWLEAECATTVGSNWEQFSDGAASAGSYLTAKSGLTSTGSAPSGVADRVSFTFNVSETGSYHMYGRVKVPNHEDNSFWIRVDGGSWILWSIDPNPNFGWHQMKNSPFNLSTTGNHTIDIAYREDGAQLDKVFITKQACLPQGVGGTAPTCNTGGETNAPEALWAEAECATAVGSNWEQFSDGAASAGTYLTIKSGLNSYNNVPTGEADKVSFSFNVGETGNYHIFARVKTPDYGSDSFWYSVDGGTWVLWGPGRQTTFTWRELSGSPFSFSPGSHTLDIAYREDGAQLDKILVSLNSTVPSDEGAPDPNCGSAGASAVASRNAHPDTKGASGFYDQRLESRSINVYPNPSNGLFHIEVSEEDFSHLGMVTIFDLKGNLVKQITVSETQFKGWTIDLKDMSPNIYLLQITTPKGTVIRRIEKI